MTQYKFFFVDKAAECMEVCLVPSSYRDKILENFYTQAVCQNAPVKFSMPSAAHLGPMAYCLRLDKSPALTLELRKATVDTIFAAASPVDYTCVGMVEFLSDKTGSFKLMEMNAQIPVEYPAKIIKDTLGVEMIIVTEHVVDFPFCLVNGENGLMVRTDKIIKARALRNLSVGGYTSSKKIMEIIFANHFMIELRKRAHADKGEKPTKKLVMLQFEAALLNTRSSFDKYNTFVDKVHVMLQLGLSLDGCTHVVLYAFRRLIHGVYGSCMLVHGGGSDL